MAGKENKHLNYKTLPLTSFAWDEKLTNPSLRISGDGVRCKMSVGPHKTAYGKIDLIPGRCYAWEIYIRNGVHFKVGVKRKEEAEATQSKGSFADAKSGFAYYSFGEKRNGTNKKSESYGNSVKKTTNFSNGDRITVYFDMVNGVLGFFLNHSYLGDAFVEKDFTRSVYVPAVSCLIGEEEFCVLAQSGDE